MANFPLTEEDAHQYREDGFLIVEDLYKDDLINSLRLEIYDVFKQKFEQMGFEYKTKQNGDVHAQSIFRFHDKHLKEYKAITLRGIQRLPEVYQVGSDQKLLDTVSTIGLDFPAFSTKPLIMLHNDQTDTSEGINKSPIHQDWRSIQGSLNNVVVWIPLVDVPREIGPVEIIPASHKNGLLPTEEDEWYAHVQPEYVDESQFEPVPVNKGDAILFSSFLLHRSGNNETDHFRISLQYRFNDLSEKTFLERNYPDPYGHAPQQELITPGFPEEGQVKNYFES